MIGFLRGDVLAWADDGPVTIDVGGVGYEVTLIGKSLFRAASLGVWIHTHATEGAAARLFGFVSPETRETFRILLGVSGVGPGTATAVLSAVTGGQLATLVKQRDVGALRRIKGVGQKTAERLVLELQGKLRVPEEPVAAPAPTAETGAGPDLVSALRNLGFKTGEAAAAVAEVLREDPLEYFIGDLDSLLKRALRKLRKAP
jgi:Holliday junction DNA helicase RuvA